MSGSSTHAQRLAWQHQETRHGYDDEPSLAEQLEDADNAFRHFDSFVFAPAPPLRRLGGNTGASGPATGSDPAGRPEVSPSPPAGSEVTGLPPLGAGGLAPSFEHYMWAA